MAAVSWSDEILNKKFLKLVSFSNDGVKRKMNDWNGKKFFDQSKRISFFEKKTIGHLF